jgi:hypothetical protein
MPEKLKLTDMELRLRALLNTLWSKDDDLADLVSEGIIALPTSV